MDKLSLKVSTRKIGKNYLKKIRKSNSVPGVIYGHNFENKFISVNMNDLKNIYKKAGTNTIIDLIDESNNKISTIIKDISFDKVYDDLIEHVDFYAIRMDEKIETKVNVVLIGESDAVKLHGGIIIHNKDSIKIRCLPAYLIHQIEVDISVLKEIGDFISIKDLSVPKEIEILDDLDDIVVSVIHQESGETEETTETNVSNEAKTESTSQSK